MGKRREWAEALASEVVRIAYYADGSVRESVAALLETRAIVIEKETKVDGGVAEEVIAALRSRVEHLELLCDQFGINANGVVLADPPRPQLSALERETASSGSLLSVR